MYKHFTRNDTSFFYHSFNFTKVLYFKEAKSSMARDSLWLLTQDRSDNDGFFSILLFSCHWPHATLQKNIILVNKNV